MGIANDIAAEREMSADIAVAKARQAANFVAAHVWPHDTDVALRADSSGAKIHVHTYSVEALTAARRFVGPVTKEEVAGIGLVLVANPEPGMRVTIWPPTGTCKRVEVGTRKVTRREPVGEVEYREVEVDEPVYEWECPPSVLDGETAAAGDGR